MDTFFTWAENNWQIEFSPSPQQFPDEIIQRYPNIPAEYRLFYEKINLCANESDTTWFLSKNDFLETNEDSFVWNTFEKISLDAADNDEELMAQIKEYWDCHLPIVLSVGGEYEYYAINVNTGAVVQGYEPEFEESSKVADSFLEFLSKFPEFTK
jgi:hypothetical protein